MMSRRCFLKWGVAAFCGYQLGGVSKALAGVDLRNSSERVLSLFNIHTGERLHTRYWARGRYDQREISRIEYLLRCHYTNMVKPISIKVIDLLHEVKSRLAPRSEINIISGYRSAQYNEYLRSLGKHVADNSFHLTGLAIDFAITGIATNDLSKTASELQAGGVGLYPDFVHIDVGPVRRW